KLLPQVADAFDAPRPGWAFARFASPDVMLEATSVEAISRGEFTAILGEVHIAATTVTPAFFLAQHPRPGELEAAYSAALPEPHVSPVHSKDWPKVTVRFTDTIDTGRSYVMETAFDPASWPRERVLALSELTVEDGDPEPIVRLPDGTVLELLDFFADPLCGAVMDFKILERRTHMPRVSIDGLVIARESWSLSADEMAFAYERDEPARFLAARRWARAAGIPRYFFAKSVIEVKPMYVDLDSPIYLGMFCKLIRAAKEHVAGETSLMIAEMLPDLEHLWLTDAAGERYTSELRIVVVDDAR
ncbi:MAG TPA: lantibiotic dehydratase, partial [Labilithrix sp.]|nr:lantibiotic dehydratase [Labilithrix sp.]